jgi:hypothetical protein
VDLIKLNFRSFYGSLAPDPNLGVRTKEFFVKPILEAPVETMRFVAD